VIIWEVVCLDKTGDSIALCTNSLSRNLDVYCEFVEDYCKIPNVLCQ